MSMIYEHQPLTVPVAASSPGYGLKVSTIFFGVIGFMTWGLSIGFTIGWGYEPTDICSFGGGGPIKVVFGSLVSVPTNAAMVYVTARIIFVITSKSFPSSAPLADLHACVARLVALTLLGLTTWIMSIAWLAFDDCEWNLVYHLCNYGFVDSALVAGLAGGLWSVTSRKTAFLPPPQHVEEGAAMQMSPTPPQTHYNQAYAPRFNQYR